MGALDAVLLELGQVVGVEEGLGAALDEGAAAAAFGGVPPVAPEEEFDAEATAAGTAVVLDGEAGEDGVGEDEDRDIGMGPGAVERLLTEEVGRVGAVVVEINDGAGEGHEETSAILVPGTFCSIDSRIRG